MKQIKAATRYMVILGRTYADGTGKDYEAVNALQAQYKVVPLSGYGKPFTYRAPPVDPEPGFSMTDKPQAVILGMSTAAYFKMMAKLMGGAAPPAPEDAPMLARMAKIGLVPGQEFDMAKLDPATQAALKNVGATALQQIEANKKSLGGMVNGWVVTKDLGVYGTAEAGRGGGLRLAGQPAAGRRLPVHRRGQRGAEAVGSPQVQCNFRQGRNAARRRFLVDHDV
jgi:hypothetical protein